jgi:hypothetical protein
MTKSHETTGGRSKGSGTPPIPGARTDPSQVPTPAHSGDNSRDAPRREGKEGNGAQKRQQERKR